MILSAGFEVQATPTATTSMDKPVKLVATMGAADGEVDLSCGAVLKAGGYLWQRREHTDAGAPEPFGHDKFSTRRSTTFGEMVSGRKYGFRVKAMGPNKLESPWSDEVICMAP